MPPSHSNPIIRILAVAGLCLAFVLVIVIFATSGGGDSGSDDGGGSAAEESQEALTPEGRRAVEKGEYVVERGDTLVSISTDTGVPIDLITQLNPELDPQTLNEGERVKLREP